MAKRVYISPSDQVENKYAWGNTNEHVQCQRIAEAEAAALRRCGGGVYRLRLIHGYHGGTALRDLCREYAGHPRVLRLVASPGSTDLVLREF